MSSAASSTPSANQAQRPQSQQGQPQQQRSAQSQQREPGPGERRGDEHQGELGGKTISDAKKVGSELVGAARDSAVSLIDSQRERAADQIIAVGDALRRSVEPLESAGADSLVRYVNLAADQVCGFAEAVRDRSWNDLAGDFEGFARRSPTLFMASAVGLGFLLGRFLLSSSDRTHTAGTSGMSRSSGRASDMRRDMGVAGRTASSGMPAAYGGSGMRDMRE